MKKIIICILVLTLIVGCNYTKDTTPDSNVVSKKEYLNFSIAKQCGQGNLAWSCSERIVITYNNKNYSYNIGSYSGYLRCLGWPGPLGKCDDECYIAVDDGPYRERINSTECQECLEKCRNYEPEIPSEKIYSYLNEHGLSNRTLLFKFFYDKINNKASNFSSLILEELNISLN